jgi:hypothetical protein
MTTRKKVRWITVLMYVLFAYVGFSLALLVLWLTGSISLGKDAPAWVQAVGSIVAILIAVAVPATQHFLTDRKQRQEVQDRARSLGLLLLPHIKRFAEHNNNIWAYEHPDHDVEDLRDNVCVLGYRTSGALDVPTEISSRIDELHALGSAAEGVQRAIFNVVSASEFVTEESVARNNGRGGLSAYPERVVFNKTKFYDLMWDALRGLTDAQNKIEAMFSHDVRRPSSRNG